MWIYCATSLILLSLYLHKHATMTAIIPMSTNTTWRFRFKLFLSLLVIIQHYNTIKERLARSAILLQHVAPWLQLMDHMDSSSFLLMTGLTWEVFNMLLDIVRPPGHPALGKQKGCKWSLPTDAQLGLMFYFTSEVRSLSSISACYLALLLSLLTNFEEHAQACC
jgi:hypothetical protein